MKDLMEVKGLILEIMGRPEARRLVSEIRDGGGPQQLYCRAYRMGPHRKSDDLRDPAEIESHREKEPIVRMHQHLDEGLKCS